MCNEKEKNRAQCVNPVWTTLDCGIEICSAFNGTIPTFFDDQEIIGISKLTKYWVIYSILLMSLNWYANVTFCDFFVKF